MGWVYLLFLYFLMYFVNEELYSVEYVFEVFKIIFVIYIKYWSVNIEVEFILLREEEKI